MAFPYYRACAISVVEFRSFDPSLRAKRSNPWPTGTQSGLLRRFAPRNDALSPLPPHLLRGLPEHVFARPFVERLFHEFADRKTGLNLRPRAHLRVPALDVRIIVERKALRLMGHGPGKAGDVGDRIVAGDVSAGFAELRIEHAVKPNRLVAIAFDGIGDLLLRIEREMSVLAQHRTEPAHLPHHPLHHPGPPAHVAWQEPAGLLGEIDQDRAGLEYRKRL